MEDLAFAIGAGGNSSGVGGYQIGSTYPSLSMSVEFDYIAREKKIARF